jgi:uncharacterized protein (DUF2384 family)
LKRPVWAATDCLLSLYRTNAADLVKIVKVGVPAHFVSVLAERMIGIARLVGQAQSIVEESGSRQNFDAAKWVSASLDRPLPALGGKCPSEFMDTSSGRSMVADLLGQQQSSAYG